MSTLMEREVCYRPEKPLILYSEDYEKQDHKKWDKVFSNKVDNEVIRPLIRYTAEKQFSSERIVIYN